MKGLYTLDYIMILVSAFVLAGVYLFVIRRRK